MYAKAWGSKLQGGAPRPAFSDYFQVKRNLRAFKRFCVRALVVEAVLVWEEGVEDAFPLSVTLPFLQVKLKGPLLLMLVIKASKNNNIFFLVTSLDFFFLLTVINTAAAQQGDGCNSWAWSFPVWTFLHHLP